MTDWLTERYRIEGTVGKGSVATVYRVWDKNDGRTIALKRLSNRDRAGYERRVALFQQEYYTLIDLAHPFIIEVYDYGLVDGDPYYTMELLEGKELGQMAPMPWQKSCRLLRDIASSLAIIHSRRLVHRDLSTRNVRCNKNGRAKLLDFGAMVSMGAVRDVVGTAAFMAPEVVYAQPLEGRADLFSLGALAYWLLSGRYAYQARSIQQLKDAWRSVPHSLAQVVDGIPSALNTLVMSMLSLDKLARPVNAAEVIERLTAIARLEQNEVLEISQAYVTTPTVVGRERELGIFRPRMLSARRGRGGTVVLEGVSGVGRSRLLSSFVLEGKLAGTTVLKADGGGAHGGDYGVISALFERLLEALPEEALDAARPEAAVLGHVIPGLRARTRESELIDRTDLERFRARVQRSLQQVFTRILSRASLMIAVDDIHLCDDPSLAALATLARIAPSYRLVLAVTLNQENDRHRSKALKALRSSATIVELKPLGENDIGWLVRSMFGDVANINIVSDWIYRLSRGNLRTCMELAQHLVDSGIARYQDGNWILPKDLREQKLPQNLRQALQVRLAKLNPAARALVESLSLVTEWAPLRLEHYVMLSEPGAQKSTYLALDDLVASQILLKSGDDYSFSQPGYIDILQCGLDEEHRQRIHLRLAEVYQSGDYRLSLIVIYHLLQAGEGAMALERFIPLINTLERLDDPYRLQIQCCETAIKLVENNKFKRREAFFIRRYLILLASQYDISLLKYAGALEEQLRGDSGLIFWQEMANHRDPSERIQRCLIKAQEIWESTAHQERGLNPSEAVRELLAYTVTVTGAVAPTIDVKFLLHLRDFVVPFRPLSPAVEFFDQLLSAAIGPLTGRSDYENRLAIQKMFSQPIPELDEIVRKEIIDYANPYYLAFFEALRADPLAFERADQIEQNPRFTAHAWEIRLVAHLFAGRFQPALACLQQKELLAIQNPESDAYLLMGLIFEFIAYSGSGDLMGLKKVLTPITEKAELYPGWIPIMFMIRGNLHLLHGELEQARRDLEKTLELAPVGQHFAWQRGVPLLVETLIEMGEYEEARKVGLETYEAGKALDAVFEALLDINRTVALADAKLGNFEQANKRIDDTIEKARTKSIDGIPMVLVCETAARVALCSKDIDKFLVYAKAMADICGPGRSPALIAKYAQLMMDADRSQLPGQWRVQTPLETDFLGTRTATNMLQLVHAAMSECTAVEQGYEKALELLVQLTEATHGYIYAIATEGLRFMAPTRIEPAPTDLSSQLCNYLENWHALRSEQQPETQTLACRTLSGTGSTERSAVITRDQSVFQPLVLWVEKEEQPEVVCVAALSVPELPLDELLWPFTSVIAHYLLELRA